MKSKLLLSSSLLLVVIASYTGAQMPRTQPSNEWTLAATGDSIITRRINVHSGEPAFDRMVQVLKQADAAFTNLEISLFNLKEFKGHPQAEFGGNFELGPVAAAYDLRDIGIDLFNRANNHTTDYGVEGMVETNQLLDRLGVTHAGSGMTLGEARAPAYFDTPKGRFALIGCASSHTPMSRAADPRPEIRGRPGLSALRTTIATQVDAATFRQLASLRRQLNPSAAEPGEVLDFFGARLKVGPKPGTRTYEINPLDLEQILRWVRSAEKQADYVVVNIHAHEAGAALEEPADFLPKFGRAAIDAGADIFIGHGPHVLRGVEVYKGKAIYYSLGNFIFQNETIEPMAQDMYENYGLGLTATTDDLYNTRFRNDTIGFPASPLYWESVIPVARYRGEQLEEIRFYPIDLGHSLIRSRRGTPRMADEAVGRKIIERLAKLSEPHGTKISFEQNVGVWRRPAGTQ